MVGRARRAAPQVAAEISLSPRAVTQLRVARAHHARLDHDEAFVHQVDAVIAAIAAMPRRFPVVGGDVRRALVRR